MSKITIIAGKHSGCIILGIFASQIKIEQASKVEVVREYMFNPMYSIAEYGFGHGDEQIRAIVEESHRMVCDNGMHRAQDLLNKIANASYEPTHFYRDYNSERRTREQNRLRARHHR
jgi:hypothetical protein